ncbi:NAD(P)H-dependent flavin oxidoreductase [Rubrobacter marinus]|uniref:NAD(P)H-dependent flavin oxidoreductase n=1 Tax=Rubrobacter marinus TaxID=2653852 RepID=UPI001A9E4376|nr:nitronate monooxygenase [Rubrobacter marinus]
METRITRLLGIEHPVVQAGMAGGPTTPRLVAAVSEAGGLGTLGAAYMTPAAIRSAVEGIRALTRKPFAVNLFVPEPFDPSLYDPQEIGASLARYREELGVEAPGELSYVQSFEDQLAVVLEERVPVFSFTFGVPEGPHLDALREAGIVTAGTATTVREALAVEAAGVDAVTAQGAEAGGHRGTFLGPYEGGLVGTMALVPQVADAVEIPVLAAGGIMDGRGLAAALALGADGAQMGTAFLACPESGAQEGYKRVLLSATEEETTVTRAFSGKAARGLKNRFTEEMEGAEVAAYPVQNAHTRDIRAAAAKADRTEFMSLWSGQAPRLARPVPAAEVVERTVAVASKLVSNRNPERGSGA